MKFAITTFLLATLATASSATAIPSTAAVGEPLPAKFTLKFTSARGTALDGHSSQVTVDHYAGQFLNIGNGSNQVQIPVVFYNSNTGIYVKMSDNFPDWFLTIYIDGLARFGWASSNVGFVQVNGALAYDAGDGNGPRALWKACQSNFFRQLWEIYFNPPSSRTGCIPVGLTVSAL